jgi:hypothetical protein
MGIIYQFSIKEKPTSETDWENCSESQYDDMKGYNIPTRKIKREVKPNDWLKLWDEFTMTPEYRQSIAALRFRAFYDWLKDNFNPPTKK